MGGCLMDGGVSVGTRVFDGSSIVWSESLFTSILCVCEQRRLW